MFGNLGHDTFSLTIKKVVWSPWLQKTADLPM